jgi:hypothetical protein
MIEIPETIEKEIDSIVMRVIRQQVLPLKSGLTLEIRSVVYKAIAVERERCKQAIVKNFTDWISNKLNKIR